jgi:hypothetical protein
MKNKIFVNSFPKGGTHLVAKLLKLMGYGHDHLEIIGSGRVIRKENLFKQLARGFLRGGWFPSQSFVLGGVDTPIGFRAEWLQRQLDKIPDNGVLGGHFRYSDYLVHLLKENDFKCIHVLRDPRDIVISHAHYVSNTPGHFLYDHYQKLAELEAQIRFSITGGYVDGVGYLESIGSRAYSLDGWRHHYGIITIRFEDLIGPEGGGRKDEQLQTIKKVYNFLGNYSTPDSVEFIQDNLFGGTRTFRSGKIGAWKDVFTDEHHKLFRKVAGDILKRWGYINKNEQ